MHISQLPKPGAYARAWKAIKALPPAALVRHPEWVRGPVPAADLLREMRDALQRRINSRGGLESANAGMPIELVRDARRLDEIKQRRIRTYQFETALCRDRFGHLLAVRGE